MMPLEMFSRIMNMGIENSDISSLKPFAESLVHQICEFHYKSNEIELLLTGLKNVRMFCEMILPISQMKKKSFYCYRD